jgi:hypothetical protein
MCYQQLIQYGIPAAISLFGAKSSADAQKSGSKKAARAAQETAMAQLGFATESRNLALQLSDPQRQAGYAATAAMMDMMGLPRTAQSSPDWYGGVTAGDYPPGIAGDDFPALGMRTHKSGMSLEGLGDDWNAFSTKSKRPAWRPYAKRLEAYIGEENMPEGIWSGKKGRTRPKKHSRRKSWREYSEALEPYAREVQGTKAAEAASRLPPGVTPPNLAGYDQYEWEADPGYPALAAIVCPAALSRICLVTAKTWGRRNTRISITG